MTESDTPETTPDENAPEAAAEAPAVEAPAATEAAEPAAEETVVEAEVEVAIDATDASDAAPAEEPVLRAAPEGVDARNPIWTVGRRKSSTARIRMFPGGGNFVINGKTQPLDVAEARKRYDVWVNVDGGGMTGQSGAIALGVARALAILEPASEQTLRDAGMMRRDARVKERKKYGRRGARRGFQFSKR
jgi:small subunit ribosomal protein S9